MPTYYLVNWALENSPFLDDCPILPMFFPYLNVSFPGRKDHERASIRKLHMEGSNSWDRNQAKSAGKVLQEVLGDNRTWKSNGLNVMNQKYVQHKYINPSWLVYLYIYFINFICIILYNYLLTAGFLGVNYVVATTTVASDTNSWRLEQEHPGQDLYAYLIPQECNMYMIMIVYVISCIYMHFLTSATMIYIPCISTRLRMYIKIAVCLDLFPTRHDWKVVETGPPNCLPTLEASWPLAGSRCPGTTAHGLNHRTMGLNMGSTWFNHGS